jgi:ribonuclease E
VIDVNTGKFTGSGGNLEETVTRNNLEAAEEIIRQLRLRDIGGIIVIDFIDMVLESNRDLVLRRLTECLGRDRTRHQVAEITSLGLVQMTRKKVGTGLLEAHSTPCEHCKGRGVLVSAEPVHVRSAVVPAGSGAGAAATRRARSRGRGSGGGAQPPEPRPAAEAAEPQAAPEPTSEPTLSPSAEPTLSPSAEPTLSPSAGPASDPLLGAASNGTATATPDSGESQPAARTTRRRRAASRPAGPPSAEQREDSGSTGQVSSTVQQAG